MKIGVMQPYLFPYIGYIQLINAVDKFVVYDDVQYINRGWINRNRILVQNKPKLFTLGVKKCNQKGLICERCFSESFNKERTKFLKTIQHSYRKAPFFQEVMMLMDSIFQCQEKKLSVFITNSLKEICRFLGIETTFLFSSELAIPEGVGGQEKILYINKLLKSKMYINPIGGVELYTKKRFEENGIELRFLKPVVMQYKQFDNIFIPNLSIIDVIMFNSIDAVKGMLKDFELIENGAAK
jgi:hypothetical protein